MAAANITITMKEHFPCPMLKQGTITFDGGNYATNGTAMALDKWLRTVEGIVFAPSAGWTFEYIPSTGKVKVMNGTTEFTNAGAISLASIPFLAWGPPA